jgi:hypothetical protein
LAGNWNIDIANELEDYLEELESVTISFDGGETNLNFAEAALLIQVGVCVCQTVSDTVLIRGQRVFTARKSSISTILCSKR